MSKGIGSHWIKFPRKRDGRVYGWPATSSGLDRRVNSVLHTDVARGAFSPVFTSEMLI